VKTASASIDTEAASARYRAAAIDLAGRRILVTNFRDSEQEQDLAQPPNCNGFGRIRHFQRRTSTGWPANPLPIEPACRALRLPPTDQLPAQVFQNAVCNWRCWYCFVPFNLLSANHAHSDWLSADELIELYLAQDHPPPVIDLTGGQPDITPEWVPWMMKGLIARGLEKAVYLWSDDNLSTDYFWRYLSGAERSLVASYPSYGRVCCFKGFDAASFAFNTKAEPSLFDRQFDLMGRFLKSGIDLYAYATLTAPSGAGVSKAMRLFVDRLQQLHHNLPLRTVPLKIGLYAPVLPRLDVDARFALSVQDDAVAVWCEELERRYSAAERSMHATDIPLT